MLVIIIPIWIAFFQILSSQNSSSYILDNTAKQIDLSQNISTFSKKLVLTNNPEQQAFFRRELNLASQKMQNFHKTYISEYQSYAKNSNLTQKLDSYFTKYFQHIKALTQNPKLAISEKKRHADAILQLSYVKIRRSLQNIFRIHIEETEVFHSQIKGLAFAGLSLLTLLLFAQTGFATTALILPNATPQQTLELDNQNAKIQSQLAEPYDVLTNLMNRRTFSTHYQTALEKALNSHEKIALLHIGLDRFKQINQSLGNSAGDKILQLSAKRIKKAVGDKGLISYFSGDEFVILFTNQDQIINIEELTEQIIKQMRKPFFISQSEIFLSASIGVSIFPDDDEDADKLVSNAGLALSAAKFSGRNQISHFTKDMRRDLEYRSSIEQDLKHAIEKDEFHVYYQPQVNIKDNHTSGVEALVRWQHPRLGLLTPGAFLDVAEASGLIAKIGDIVLDKSLQAICNWQKEKLDCGTIAINISSHQFADKNLFAKIKSALEHYKISPQKLAIEITENVLLSYDSFDIAETLQQFRDYGIDVDLDDFGTGYASLTHLSQLPITRLKIDRSFISGLPSNERSCDIVKTIVNLAKNLELSIIAEGVETDEQIRYLKNCDCFSIQGFRIAKPMPNKDLTTWLKIRDELPVKVDFIKSA
ncbi:MAG: bifunctional diguanylate cyclase/phosphodiesterase [Pseudomonadota bacterium]